MGKPMRVNRETQSNTIAMFTVNMFIFVYIVVFYITDNVFINYRSYCNR